MIFEVKFNVFFNFIAVSATQINFKYPEHPEQVVDPNRPAPIPTHEDELQNQLAAQLNLPSLSAAGNVAGTSMPSAKAAEPAQTFGAQTKMFAQQLTRKYF